MNLDPDQKKRLAELTRSACLGPVPLDVDLYPLQLRALRLYTEKSVTFLSRYTKECRTSLQRYESGEQRIPLDTALIMLRRMGYRLMIEKDK